jgi:hypothetical protein
MADPTNPGQPSDSSTERGSPVNVNTTGDVTVTRRDVKTGDTKELQTDLLNKLCDCIEKQTQTLGGLIDEAKKDIVAAISSGGSGGSGGLSKDDNKNLDSIADNMKAIVARGGMGGGGGGDDGPGGGGSAGGSRIAAKAAAKEWDELEGVLKKNKIQISKWGSLFKEGALIQLERNIGNLNKVAIDLGQSLGDISAGWRKAANEAKSLMELGQGGMIDVTALYQDLGAGIFKNRDALQSTTKTLLEFRDQNHLLIGTLGSDLEQVSQAFRRNRDAVDNAFGDDLLGRIPFEDQNAILTDILSVQRRMGVQTEATQLLESKSTRTTLETLNLIAFQTGQTVKEVAKLYKEEVKTFDVMAKLGLLDPAKVESTALNARLLKDMGQGTGVDLATEIIQAGGLQRWLGKDETGANAALAAIPGNMEKLVQGLEGFTSGTAAGRDAFTESFGSLGMFDTSGTMDAAGMIEAFPAFQKFSTVLSDSMAILTAQQANNTSQVEVEKAKAAYDASISGKIGGTIAGAWHSVMELLSNNLGGGGDLAVAILHNTIAVNANTLSRVGGKALGAVKGLLGKLPGGLGKFFSGPMGGVTTSLGAAPTVAAPGAARGALSTLGRGAAMGGSLLASGAAVAGAGYVGYQIGKEVIGPLIDAATEKLTGVEDATLGSWLASAFGADATTDAQKEKTAARIAKVKAAAARRKGVSAQKAINPSTLSEMTTVAPSDVSSSEATTELIDNPTTIELIKQTAHLETLITLTTEGNATRNDTMSALLDATTPITGKHTSPKQRRGAETPPDAYSPLFVGS